MAPIYPEPPVVNAAAGTVESPHPRLTLVQLRQALEVSQTTLAAAAGIARSTLSAVENGRVVPQLATQEAIIRGLRHCGWTGKVRELHWERPPWRDPAWGGAVRPAEAAQRTAQYRARTQEAARLAAEQAVKDQAAAAEAERQAAWAEARRQWKQKDHAKRLAALRLAQGGAAKR